MLQKFCTFSISWYNQAQINLLLQNTLCIQNPLASRIPLHFSHTLPAQGKRRCSDGPLFWFPVSFFSLPLSPKSCPYPSPDWLWPLHFFLTLMILPMSSVSYLTMFSLELISAQPSDCNIHIPTLEFIPALDNLGIHPVDQFSILSSTFPFWTSRY